MSSKDKHRGFIDNIINNDLFIILAENVFYNKYFYVFREHINGELVHKIYMNVGSVSLLIKSLLLKYPQATYLSSIFNFFQSLKTSNEKGYINYSTSTHALTLYCLKLLERRGVVTIIKYVEISNQDYTDEYRIIGNDRPKKDKRKYDVCFYKLRDIEESDLEQIRKIESFLNIPEGMISYTIENGKLKAQLNRHIIEENLSQSETKKQNEKQFQMKKKK